MVNLKKIGPKSLAELEMLWASLYEDIYGILGTAGVIMAMGDPAQGLPDATTFKTRAINPATNEFTFTWSGSGGPHAFAAPFDLTNPDSYQGIIPVIESSGTADECDTPDAPFFSRDDTSAEGFSIAMWVNVTDSAAQRTLMSKYRTTATAQKEWELQVKADDTLLMLLADESAGAAAFRTSDSAISMDTWRFFVATYDGGGGGTAAAGIILYEDAVVLASTATENSGGTYVGMEDLTAKVGIGAANTDGPGTRFYLGQMAGGPLGPIFRQSVLTPDEITRLYELGRRALAL